MNRPKSPIEEMGDRCLKVVHDYADAKEPSLEMLAAFAWALDCPIRIQLSPRDHAEEPRR